jgi:hypothetical protein
MSDESEDVRIINRLCDLKSYDFCEQDLPHDKQALTLVLLDEDPMTRSGRRSAGRLERVR